jgi:hypothetical protein
VGFASLILIAQVYRVSLIYLKLIFNMVNFKPTIRRLRLPGGPVALKPISNRLIGQQLWVALSESVSQMPIPAAAFNYRNCDPGEYSMESTAGDYFKELEWRFNRTGTAGIHTGELGYPTRFLSLGMTCNPHRKIYRARILSSPVSKEEPGKTIAKMFCFPFLLYTSKTPCSTRAYLSFNICVVSSGAFWKFWALSGGLPPGMMTLTRTWDMYERMLGLRVSIFTRDFLSGSSDCLVGEESSSI